jgi:dUTP pyrophosphatase
MRRQKGTIMSFEFIFVGENNERLFPKRATPHSSGFDLASASHDPIVIKKGERALVPTGIALALPPGFEGQVRPRSGLALKQGVTVLNAPGTIDADYSGEIKVILANFGDQDFVIDFGMRIAQLVIARVEMGALILAGQVNETSRGANGFGSSGVM